MHRFSNPASEDLFGGVTRNFQLFEPLDFLAELTQHIPNKGEHLIRYYGCYSNKNRGTGILPVTPVVEHPPPAVSSSPSHYNQGEGRGEGSSARRRWAALINRAYQADPLRCPHCGGAMKIIAFVEARQGAVLEKILRHCGLWEDPPYRGPPSSSPSPWWEGRGEAMWHSRPGCDSRLE